MRAHGLLDEAQFDRHDHVAWCGTGPTELADVAVQSFARARPDERLLFLCDDPSLDHLAALPDRDRMLADGTLVVADTHDVYRPVTDLRSDFVPLAQLAEFDAILDRAVADGFAGLRVVAENTRMLQGDAAAVRRWLAWEQVTDQWQARRPVTGTCFFDRSRVDPARLDAALGLHPLLRSPTLPPLRAFTDGVSGALVLVGSVEAFDDQRFGDLVDLAASTGELVLDLRDLDYLHHRALAHLAALARTGVRITMRGASPLVARLRSHLPAESAMIDWT